MATDCIAQVTFGFESKGEAGRRPLRHAARQFGRRGGAAEEPRYPAAADQAPGRVPGRWAPAGQGPARNAGAAPAARVRDRLWLRRLQRRRPAGRRRDPQAAGRPRSDRGPGPGLAADALAVRERGGVAGAARHGARAGRHRDRNPAAPPEGARHAHHDRPRPHRRPDPRPAGVHLLQRPLRHLVLSAGRGHGDLQRRGGAVCRGRRAAAGQRAGHPRGPGDPAAAAGEAARRLSDGHLPGAPGWGLCPPQAVPVSRAAAGRVRRGHGQQSRGWRSGPGA